MSETPPTEPVEPIIDPQVNEQSESVSAPKKVTPLQCFTGAIISGSLSFLLYLLTRSIAATFAAKPFPHGNAFTLRIAAAVRTLVVSTVSLGTFVFGIVALGLFLLGVQVTIQTLKKRFSPS